MPINGPPPKGRHLRRRSTAPTHDWVEIPDVPFEDAPPLPRRSPRKLSGDPPAPPRPLDAAGVALWSRVWRSAGPDFGAVETLLFLAELADERAALRLRVLSGADWRDRVALRQLDGQLVPALADLERAVAIANPAGWPTATRTWYRNVARLPHAATWTDADWQFAHDTARLVAALHLGERHLAQEVRTRERIMGTTADARRACRIRYVDAEGQPTERDGAVVAMDAYRRAVADDS